MKETKIKTMKNKKSIWSCLFSADETINEYEHKDEEENLSCYENSIIIEEESSIIEEKPSSNMTILEFMRINNNSIEKLAR